LTDIYEEFTGVNNSSIDRFLGVNDQSLFNPQTSPTTGNDGIQYQVLIYNSIKELYYSNFLTSSYGSPFQTQSLLPGEDSAGDTFFGNPDSSGRYENYLQTTDKVLRYFPTSSGDQISVLSIPSRLYGDYIQPGSFIYTCVSASRTHSITDDTQGNLYTNGAYCGNIIYTHGIAVFTFLLDNSPPIPPEGYGVSEYGGDIYGGGLTIGDIFSPNATGAIINKNTIPILKAKIICGAANNQLEDMKTDGELIHNRGVIYVPDFLTNRMGIVTCANEQYGYVNNDPLIENHFNKEWEHSIFNTSLQVLKESKGKNIPTAEIAFEIANRLSREIHPVFGHRGKEIIRSLVDNGWHLQKI